MSDDTTEDRPSLTGTIDATTDKTLSATVSLDCPKCGVEVSASIAKDMSFKPLCGTCGWAASFSLKVSF